MRLASPALSMFLSASLLCGVAVSADYDEQLPVLPEGKVWQLVWQDEFTGDQIDRTKWDIPPEGRRKGGWWSPQTISLDGDGHLVISTLKDGDRYLGGCVRTRGRFEHAFGYYVARIKLQSQPGHWTAFWLWNVCCGRNDDGRDGTEIDIMEKPWRDNRVQQTLHWGRARRTAKSAENVARVPGVMEGWHTFSLWWKTDEYIFYVDGKETWRTDAGGVCQVPLYVKVSDEIGEWGGDITKAELPDHLYVDYVRVYDVADAD